MISFLDRTCLLFLFGGLPVATAHAVETSYSVLHSFHGEESNPQAPLTSDGHGNLYGTTISGGGSDYGTVFTIRTDGTGFQRLHTFYGGASDGFWPLGSLILDGFGTMYGTTLGGGDLNAGTVFSMRVDGGGFRVLHSFRSGASDGAGPFGALVLDGAGILYGTTRDGGSSLFGTVFRLRTDGTGFQVLHSFAGGAGDGRAPIASLLLDGSGNLYGTTIFGGQTPVSDPFGDIIDGRGTVFRIKTDGTGFQLMHAFLDDPNDGSDPSGSLITDGSGNLYGMTFDGGAFRGGTVFRIGVDGSGFQILHSFAGGATDGNEPVGSLILDRTGSLFGVTQGSGSAGLQMIFKIRTDGTAYQALRAFVDLTDGYGPVGSLVLDDSENLYGAMTSGGSFSAGTLFSLSTDGRAFQVLYAFAGFKSDGAHPMASVISDGLGYLYGTTSQGGSSNGGTIFRIRSDSSGFQIVHSFSGWPGSGPHAPLTIDRSGNLYGTTIDGGPSNSGTVFKMRTDGTGFEILHAFLGGADDGRYPTEALILDGENNLYGSTLNGGPDDAGVIFTMKADGSDYRLLHAFGSGEVLLRKGAGLNGSLLLDGSGGLLGTATYGGPGGHGTVFKVRTDGTGFQVLHSFAGPPEDGMMPTGSLRTDAAGSLYGTTLYGGSSYEGTVFKMKADGSGFQILHSFADSANNGGSPNTEVTLDGFGNIYGTTNKGGPSDVGTVFTVRTDGAAFQVLHAFGVETGDGQSPGSSLFLDSSGTLIGTTAYGGAGSSGTVFALSIGRHHPVVTLGPFVPVQRH